mmetsp:Transcript_95345/g.213254  ORF Transcript_95345/g.213254 Transcript_95345/m.213254 type:complete len:632 (-) Transcript_95345:43-1938(-)
MSLGRFDGADAELLSELLDLLSRPIHKDGLLLSDLGALLPTQLRRHAKQHGGLRGWLMGRPMFVMGRHPGKETVALLGDEEEPKSKKPRALAAKPSADQPDRATPPRVWKPVSSPDSTIKESPGNHEVLTPEQARLDESAVLLRGLPFSTTVEDLHTWLGDHSAHLAEGREEAPIRIMLNHLGRATGFAHVQFVSPEASRACADALHLRELEERYVEVFVYSERPLRMKARERQAHVVEAQTPEAKEALDLTPEQVLAEVRAYMSVPGRQVLLLSKLGVALSPGVRAFLKQPDMGLKTFLSQFTEEFLVEGGQGCHQVTLLGAADSGTEGCSGLERTSRNAERLLTSPLPSPQRMREPLSSPSEQRCLRTPSDWGTPLHCGSPDLLVPWPWSGNDQGEACPPFPVPPPLPGLVQVPAPEPKQISATKPSKASVWSDDESEPSQASVWLSGLPFAASEEDVLELFAEHGLSDRIVDGPSMLQPGEVVVGLRDSQDAPFVQQALNGQCVGGRYIEIFLNAEDGGDGAIATGTSSLGFAASTGSGQPDEGTGSFGEMGPWGFPVNPMATAAWQRTWGTVLGHQPQQDMGDETFWVEMMSADAASRAFWDGQHLMALAQAKSSAAAAAGNSQAEI